MDSKSRNVVSDVLVKQAQYFYNKLQEELLRTTQLVYSYQDGKGMVPRLREPRNLYALAKELGPQQAARWPSDIQVLNEKVKHIRYVPPTREPFYKPTGLEKAPMVRGEENGGKVVYYYEPRSSFFIRSRVGGARSGPDKLAVDLEGPDDTTLLFESRFESGNLSKAVKVNETDYELWLRYDLYTNKHTQWFYFRVKNTRPNMTYRFTIVNFMKSDSLYNYGMRPVIYETTRGDKPFYSLTFTVQFPYAHDTDYLLECSNDPIKSKICKQRVLCRTLAGNLVYVLTITSPSQNPEDIKFKYDSCKFKVQRSKEGTGRIVMWNMGIMNSYTMEATFCGSSMGKLKGYHFSVEDYEYMGFHFCDTLLDYCDPDNTKASWLVASLGHMTSYTACPVVCNT
ncbi:hypothetical protein KUTeg_022860 [Tegillarca granosa]|uniref:Cytosolic carboxypeptidase N-terminal domain-containing protein n=1 Tax=Tegillarca granosa TaxID=220873 RepID=A0ABQ9E5L6_TEGGR|nr:hypothetical protein KUTeg_022860 [Tegillarca granosa]